MVAGGTESMSMVPMGGNKVSPNPGLVDSYPDVYLSTGLVAENHARESGISREEQDAFALRSHQRAVAAIEAGRFKDEIVPLTVRIVDAGANRQAAGKRDDARSPSTPTKVRGATLARGARQAEAGVPRHRHRHRRQLVADERRRRGGGRDSARAARRHTA